jgi:hypothetical protein
LVVIGDVRYDISYTDPAAHGVDASGRSSRFRLDVVYVLRGDASASLLVEDELSGPCSGPILARRGDRIAIALGLTDKLLFKESSWSAVAWIRGTPVEYEGIERVTVSSAFRVLGLEPPDTATLPTAPGRFRLSDGIALLAGLIGAAAAIRMTSRSRRFR